MHDPRLTPARGDLAAKYLEGTVKAARFVTGEEFEIVTTHLVRSGLLTAIP